MSAIVELIADKLPNTPPRTALLGLNRTYRSWRVGGLGLAPSGRISVSFSVLLASLDALARGLIGYHRRGR